MPRFWLVPLQRALTIGVALAFVAGPVSMAATDCMPAAQTIPHGDHHSDGGGHQPGHHQQSDCCESCAAHCAGLEGVGPAVVHPTRVHIARPLRCDTRHRPIPRNPQLRLPPSQGPPTSLL